MAKRNNTNLRLENHAIADNEGGILARLLRGIINSKGWTNKIGFFVDRYGNKQKNSSQYSKVKSKSTIITNLTSSSITFKVFIDLLKNVFNVKKMTIIIEAEFSDGEKASSHVTFTMDNIKEKEDEQT